MKAFLARDGGRPLRFLIAGGLNTAIGLAFYPLLLWVAPVLQTHYMVGLAISQATCLCIAYVVYKIGVFRTRGNMLKEFARFASFYLINYATNWLALPLLVEGAGVPPIIAQSLFTILIIVGSYFWHSRLTFKPTED